MQNPQARRVGDVMTPCSSLVSHTATIAEALALLEHQQSEQLPVERAGVLVGMVSRAELKGRGRHGLLARWRPEPKMVWEVMASRPLSFRSDLPLPEALETMLGHGLRVAPVVDADGRPLGLLSLVDVGRSLLSQVRAG